MSSAADSSKNYLNEESGLWSWLTTLDHKRIGIMYMITVLTFFFIGGVFALLIRAELFSVGPTVVEGAAQYNQLMTFHGAIMVFMVIIPGIPAFLGNFFLPLQIGAKDVAFPKVNLMSWYCYVLGAGFAFLSIFLGGADTDVSGAAINSYVQALSIYERGYGNVRGPM